jgi:membrane protein implicated in regulation of membrane protease activity
VGAAILGSSLPLLGLEFKILSLVILTTALVWLLRKTQQSPEREPEPAMA